MQILVLGAVILASTAILVASHRAGHALFVRASAAICIVATLMLAGLLFMPGRGTEVMPTDQLTVTVQGAFSTERGTRIDGEIYNGSNVALAEARISASLACSPPCEGRAEEHFTLIRHVPVGARYPFSQVVGLAMPADAEVEWTLTIEGARAFR